MKYKFINPKFLIPVAAFAITVTGASAFTGGGTAMLSVLHTNLTDAQKTAWEQADAIRTGARTKADKVLADAGIDRIKMSEIHNAMRQAHEAEHKATDAALEANDFAAFTAAASSSPLADKVTTQDQFDQFVKAHNLMKAGDMAGAKSIMDTLGIAPRGDRGDHMDGDGDRDGMMGGRHGRMMGQSTTSQQ